MRKEGKKATACNDGVKMFVDGHVSGPCVPQPGGALQIPLAFPKLIALTNCNKLSTRPDSTHSSNRKTLDGLSVWYTSNPLKNRKEETQQTEKP